MEYGPDNSKLEELMEDPQKQEEFIEELKESQLFLPVIYSENMFEGIENAKEGDVFTLKEPSGFDINFLTDNNGNRAIPLFTSSEKMGEGGLRSSAMVMYVPDLANMFKNLRNNYKYITINPMSEIGADIPIVPFIKMFGTSDGNPVDVDVNDPESVGYMVYKAAYENVGLFVHDINLPDEWAKKYETGALIKERGFVDMTNKIGQMTTSHRYAIISNHVLDFSQFEHDTEWGLHTAARDSKFKVLDVYEFNGKTQILLLHLMDNLEEFFVDDDTIDEDFVNLARKIFEESFEKEIIPEVNSQEWLDRCSFPIGMDDEGNLWNLDDD
ncbi:MAG: SseB family protein [Methanobrevibacter sp.]|nr:SseB family protein [Methanobrevibacter sp.]